MDPLPKKKDKKQQHAIYGYSVKPKHTTGRGVHSDAIKYLEFEQSPAA